MKRGTAQVPIEAARGQVVKRSRTSGQVSQVGSGSRSGSKAVTKYGGRTSSLAAPNMQLNGHGGPIYSCRFSTTGQHIASASFDRTVLLSNTFGEECDNFAELKGHKNAVLDVGWSKDDRTLYTASADHTVATWDVRSGSRIRKHEGHEGVVNTIDVHKRGNETIVSGADDATIGLWDPRTKAAIDYMETEYAVTAVAISANGSQIFSGGLDDEIKVWDVRKRQVVYTLPGHDGTVTSLAVSPDGSKLLSNGTDDHIHVWNIQPFAPEDRRIATLDGAVHGNEQHLIRSAWSGDGKQIASGSSDRNVILWDVMSGNLVYKLPGHKGVVTSCDLHPTQPIILSGSIDRTLFLGELA